MNTRAGASFLGLFVFFLLFSQFASEEFRDMGGERFESFCWLASYHDSLTG